MERYNNYTFITINIIVIIEEIIVAIVIIRAIAFRDDLRGV